jgi:hypothetical protein
MKSIPRTRSDDQAVTGYLATTYVDGLNDTNCVVHISSLFDVPQPADRAVAAARFEAVYLAMFDGYRQYFTCRRAR